MSRQLVPIALLLLLKTTSFAQAQSSIAGRVQLLSTKEGVPEVSVSLCPDTGREVTTVIEGPAGLPPLGQIREIRIPHVDTGLAATYVVAEADCPDARRTITAPDGSFGFADVQPGKFSVVAQREGYIGEALRGTPPKAVKQSITVTAQQSALAVSLSLIRGGTIAGTVRDTDGRPLANLAVKVIAAKGSTAIPLASNQTDDRGQYRLFWVPPGEYFVLAQWAGSPTQASNLSTYHSKAASTEATLISIREGEAVSGIDILMRQKPAR